MTFAAAVRYPVRLTALPYDELLALAANEEEGAECRHAKRRGEHLHELCAGVHRVPGVDVTDAQHGSAQAQVGEELGA